MSSSTDVTKLLLAWEAGDKGALDRLMPLVSEELHQRAWRYLRRERSEHTLQATALVNEAYIKLVDQKRIRWQNRVHFFAIAANTMRRILVDHARKHLSEKRGNGVFKVPMNEASGVADEPDIDLIALDQALHNLAEFAPRQCRIIELRYFGGLTIRETAKVLGVCRATVKTDWNMARAWLYKELGGKSI